MKIHLIFNKFLTWIHIDRFFEDLWIIWLKSEEKIGLIDAKTKKKNIHYKQDQN